MNVDLFMGRYSLIVSESPKTRIKYVSELVRELIRRGYDDRIYIIDLAPQNRDIGIRLSRYLQGFKKAVYRYSREIRLPSLDKSYPVDMVFERNRRVAEEFFNDFQLSGRDVLVVNDLYIYLLSAEPNEFLEHVKPAKTLIASSLLSSDPLFLSSLLEPYHGRRVDELMRYMDNVIKV